MMMEDDGLMILFSPPVEPLNDHMEGQLRFLDTLEPLPSRNWDDEEEAQDVLEASDVSTAPVWKAMVPYERKSPSARVDASACDLLVLGVHGVGASFGFAAWATGTGAVSCCQLGEGDCAMEDLPPSTLPHSPREPGCHFLRLLQDSPTVCVVLCQSVIAVERSCAWARFIMDYVKPKKVVVLDGLLNATYRTETYPPPYPPCLRTLCTDAWHALPRDGKPDVPALESPNLLTGIGSAILSHCQRRNIPAALFVSLLDSCGVTLEAMEAFTTVLAPLGIPPTPSSEDEPSVRGERQYATTYPWLCSRLIRVAEEMVERVLVEGFMYT